MLIKTCPIIITIEITDKIIAAVALPFFLDFKPCEAK